MSTNVVGGIAVFVHEHNKANLPVITYNILSYYELQLLLISIEYAVGDLGNVMTMTCTPQTNIESKVNSL